MAHRFLIGPTHTNKQKIEVNTRTVVSYRTVLDLRCAARVGSSTAVRTAAMNRCAFGLWRTHLRPRPSPGSSASLQSGWYEERNDRVSRARKSLPFAHFALMTKTAHWCCSTVLQYYVSHYFLFRRNSPPHKQTNAKFLPINHHMSHDTSTFTPTINTIHMLQTTACDRWAHHGISVGTIG